MASGTLIQEAPQRRFNPLTGEWLLVSPHRNKRPWHGRIEVSGIDQRPRHDPKCHLCPGTVRSAGAPNPDYKGVYVFDNDFPALLLDTPDGSVDDRLFRAENVRGTARVICYSDRHDLTLPEMAIAGIRAVVDEWANQVTELGERWDWVAVFENKGQLMGCSQPHPHGQIWASNFVPNEVTKEDAQQRKWLNSTEQVLLVEYAEQESLRAERVVFENDTWIAVVPWWAAWPFETLLIPRRHVRRLPELMDGERDDLAGILKQLTIYYDNLFQIEFPYTMGWHGAPLKPGNNDHWQLHAHFYPPLLRSATVRKFMVGYEMLAEPQRDLTPESAAERLRGLPKKHYKAGAKSRAH